MRGNMSKFDESSALSYGNLLQTHRSSLLGRVELLTILERRSCSLPIALNSVMRCESDNYFREIWKTKLYSDFALCSLTEKLIDLKCWEDERNAFPLHDGERSICINKLMPRSAYEAESKLIQDDLKALLLLLNLHLGKQPMNFKRLIVLTEIIQQLEICHGSINSSLKQISDEMQKSERWLGNVMLEGLGLPFRHLLRNARNKYAAKRIQKEQCLVKCLAEQMGFSDSSNFHRDFKNFWGVSPLEFKASRPGTIAEWFSYFQGPNKLQK